MSEDGGEEDRLYTIERRTLSLLERPLSLFISKDVFEILGRRGSKSSKSEITRIFRIQLIHQGSSGKFISRHEGQIKDTQTSRNT